MNGTLDYCCTGLCVEVLQILAERMSFTFELYDVPDGNWGVRNNVSHRDLSRGMRFPTI